MNQILKDRNKKKKDRKRTRPIETRSDQHKNLENHSNKKKGAEIVSIMIEIIMGFVLRNSECALSAARRDIWHRIVLIKRMTLSPPNPLIRTKKRMHEYLL